MNELKTTPSLWHPLRAGLLGRCPRCGHGALFQHFMAFKPSCDHCNMSYANADTGDGPMVFVTLFAGAIVVGLLFYVQAHFDISAGYLIAGCFVLTIITCILLLRPIKALHYTLQYHFNAQEGRLE